MKLALSLFRRSSISLSKRSAVLRKPVQFHFSDQLQLANRSREKLCVALDKEIEVEEEENSSRNTELDNEISEFITNNNWSFNMVPESTRITLSKSLGTTDVRVISFIRSPDNENENENEQASEEEGEEGEDKELQNYQMCEFVVAVDKQGKQGTMVVEIVSLNSELMINNFFVTEDLEKFLVNRNQMGSNETYTGPLFETLDDKVQNSMVNYLKSMGIDSEMGNFIENVTLDLEQRYYSDWLNKMHDFLN